MDARQRHHPSLLTRRAALQAGAIGLGMAELSMLPAIGAAAPAPKAKSVIFVFLTGGLSQHDAFDPKPDAPAEIRGEFSPIATSVPGIQISEHLPLLAARARRFALVRSMRTNSDGHELACHMLLTGRLDLPAGFTLENAPNATEWPSIPATVTYALRDRGTASPTAVVLPQPSVNEAGKVRPGQYGGKMGNQWDAWHVDVASPCALGNGACPNCFRFEGTPFEHGSETIFDTPRLVLPDGGEIRLAGRVDFLQSIQEQQLELARAADRFGRHRQQALSVLTDSRIRSAFDVEKADERTLARYGKNKFGLSVLMAKRLVEGGVRLVQVNLGKNSSWDTHRRNFVNLKENLLPPLDQCISALLDDLAQTGLLDETLVIVTGEFGRTPKINKDAGRDHWGRVNSLLLAGGGVRGGLVIGASDRLGGDPLSDVQTPENLAATMYQALGIPRDATWTDTDGRPHQLFHASPIAGLM
ncbi:MAG: DUF1501 domain-containing protein [Planctomycetaceae bacterium]|nr:DUF1501 domain-containing protein [Planctomycetaceae bacterium]